MVTFLGIAHREPGYDKYMNSQECLIGPGTDFLADYRILLRADMDTFPTPRFRGFWPEGVLVDSHYSTNFNLRSIKHALKKVACEAGLEHKGFLSIAENWPSVSFHRELQLFLMVYVDDFLFAGNSTIEWQCLAVHTRIHNVNIL